MKFLGEKDSHNLRKRTTCKDGFSLSIQASRFHYCTPRQDVEDDEYMAVEVGFPSEAEPLLMQYADCPDKPTDTIYGYVPVSVVGKVIEKHGGIA